MASNFEVIGKSHLRKDARDKVTGAAQYTADMPVEGVLWGSLVRSKTHAARLKRVNTSKAARYPGVVAVLTASDVPGTNSFGVVVSDQPVMAQDTIRHFGEPLALVIAQDQKAAMEASALVEVELEDLEPVLDPEDALQPGARPIHPGGNLLSEYDICKGESEKGFKEADVILEDVFEVPRIIPGYMEVETSLARMNPDGTISVWVSSQQPFTDQREIAEVLGLGVEKIQVIGSLIGGAFGGKEDAGLAILAALGALKTGRPVRLVNDRRESFLAHPKRHPARIYLKIGAYTDGRITALDARVFLDTGAFASLGPSVGSLLTETIGGPYHIPNMHVHTRVAYTNSPFSGAMRGFGNPQAHFAMESMMDILAEKLGMNPVDLRRENLYKPGDQTITTVKVPETTVSLQQILNEIEVRREQYLKIPPNPGKKAGVGFALAIQTMGLGAKLPDNSSHRLEWQPDGSVLLYIGSPDLGQGLITVTEQMVAERLGISYDQVRTVQLDTWNSPNGNLTCASRMTYLVGNAVLAASDELIQQLLEKASAILNVDPRNLTYKSGQVLTTDGKVIPVSEFLGRVAEGGEKMQAVGTASFPYPVETTPQHLPVGMPHVLFIFGGQIVRVEVDPELGSIEITHIAAIHDVGKVINRAGVEGQIQGGLATGIGYALMEEMVLKANNHWVDSFSEYLLPTALDVTPKLEIVLLELPERSGPYGAKGVGEICLVPTGPAIANAVFQAVGVRVKKLPIQPEDLFHF